MPALSFSVLRLPSFRLLLLTRAMGTMAMQAQAVIVGWQIYSLTKSVWLLGLVGLAEAVPAIGFALFAGHFVDRYLPGRVYKLCLAAVAANTVFLCLAGSRLIAPTDETVLWMLYGGVFVSGLTRTFVRPAATALLPQLVDRADLPSGTAWNTSFVQIAKITGPALAGLLYAAFGAQGAWLFPTFLTCAATLSGAFIQTMHRDAPAAKRDPAWDSIKTGWRFLVRHPVVFPVMVLDMTAVLFGGVTAILPAYADQVLHVGARGLGALNGAQAVGAVMVALFFAVLPMRFISTRKLLWAIAGFGISIIGLALSRIFWLAMLFLVLAGALDTVNMVIRQVLFQVLTPQHLLGRVSSVNGMFITSSNEIGAFESGTAASLLGLVPSIMFGGVATLLIVAATAIFAPKLRDTIIDTRESVDPQT